MNTKNPSVEDTKTLKKIVINGLFVPQQAWEEHSKGKNNIYCKKKIGSTKKLYNELWTIARFKFNDLDQK